MAGTDSSKRRRVKLDTALFGEREAVQVRRDLVDCQILVCSLEVLVTFSDNFDYQSVQDEFISGVLAEEELGTKLHVHLAEGCYAARILNPRSYDAVSRDILQRWAFPFAPDANWWSQGTHTTTFALSRQHVYRESDVRISRSAEVGQDCALGSGTQIMEGAVVTESVLGRNCRIGKNAQIHGSYLHDDVTIGDNAHVTSAMVCQGAVVHEDAGILPGAIISCKVVIGAGHAVNPNQRITLCEQQQAGTVSYSDQEQEYSDQEESGDEEVSTSPRQQGDKPQALILAAASALAAQHESVGETSFDIEAVGEGGAGYVWLPQGDDPHSSLSFEAPGEDDEEGASSDGESAVSTTETADITLVDPEAAGIIHVEPEAGLHALGYTEHVAGMQLLMAVRDGSDATYNGDCVSTIYDVSFKREVSETVLRCAQQGFDPSFAVVELNGLKIAEDRTFADCTSAILATLLGLCFPAGARTKAEYEGLYPASAADTASPAGKAELMQRVNKQLDAWGDLLLRFLKTEDEQVELVLTLEEFCSGEGSQDAESNHGPTLAPMFAQVLKMLYDKEIVTEEAILAWADEKESAEAHERVFLKRAADFLKWLREAEEEEESDEDEDDADEED